MNVYTCTGFTGVQPTGTAALIMAPNKEYAKVLLERELASRGLKQEIKLENIVRVSTMISRVEILCDGDY